MNKSFIKNLANATMVAICLLVGTVMAQGSGTMEDPWLIGVESNVGGAGSVIAVLNNRTLTISGTGAMAEYNGSLMPPPWYDLRISIDSVVIEYGVTTIGVTAFFECLSLSSVTIPNSVTTIGRAAFSGCRDLKSVTIPNSVTTIGDGAFGGAGLTSVTIPNSVTRIGLETFRGCANLVSVTIPSSVTHIARMAFSNCRSLTSVTIPNSVTSIGDNTFSDCTSLTSINVAADNANYSSEDGVLFNKLKTTLILYPNAKKDTSYTIPSSVTSIYTSSGGATSIEMFTCRNLMSINVVADNANYSSEDGVLFDKIKTTLIKYPEGKQSAYIVPNSVTTIRNSAFSNCIGLTSIEIPNSVTSIGNRAFEGCTGLRSITSLNDIPPTIWSNTFTNKNIIRLNVPQNSIIAYQEADFWNEFVWVNEPPTFDCGEIPGTVIATLGEDGTLTISGTGTVVNNNGWGSSRNITNIIIDVGVGSINGNIFSGCVGLTSIYVMADNANYSSEDGILFDKLKTTLIAYPRAKDGTSYTIPNNVTRIGDGAFSYCSDLTSVTIPNSVTWIGHNAFSECSGLISVTIPSSVTYIGGNVFHTRNLTSINVAADNANYSSEDGILFNKLKTILIKYPNAKDGTSYTIPNSVTNIVDFAFFNCTGLTSVTIPNSVTYIGNNTFFNCSGLTSVTIPNSVTWIGHAAFSGCVRLTSITSHRQTPPGTYTYSRLFDDVVGAGACLYVPQASITSYRTADGWSELICIKAIVLPMYTVTYNTGANGSLTVKANGSTIQSGASVEDGMAVVFEVTPLPGYKAVWGGVATDNVGNTFTIEMLGADVVVTIAFEFVNAATPTITAQPASGTVTAGTARTLSVTANRSDGGTLSYQWYSNTTASNVGGTVISGATARTYSPNTEMIGTFYYYVVVTNTNNSVTGDKAVSVTSNVATLSVVPIVNAVEPTITSQPTGGAVTTGAVYTLWISTSVSDGGTLSYQWYSSAAESNVGGTVISGATSASYTPSTDAAGTFYYYVVVTNTNSGVTGDKVAMVTSDVAVLICDTPPPSSYTVTVIDGKGSGTYPVGSEVILWASSAPAAYGSSAGYRFVRWEEVGSGDLAFRDDGLSGKTSFTMPARDVIVRAVYVAYSVPTFVVSSVSKSLGKARVYLEGDAVVNTELAIYDAMGNIVRQIDIADGGAGATALGRPSSGTATRRVVAEWNLRDKNGKPVSKGTYLLRGVVTTTDGKRERVSVLFGVH